MSKKNEISIRSSAAEYLTYVATVGDRNDSIEMRYEDENIWLTQKMMATLYDVELSTINEHIKKVFNDSELEEKATIRKFRIVQTEGSRQVEREINHYNLQMIIAVGFKVNNERAVQFRKWANGIVKNYTIKGWVIDDEDWSKRLDLFLMADDREVLQDSGKITADIAKSKAETEFEKYRIIQDSLFMSDYDKYLLELEDRINQ